MTSTSLDQIGVLVGSAVVAALVATAPAEAQDGGSCAGVVPNGCAGDFPCKIVADQVYGSVEWDDSNACLAECPEPVHCGPDFANNVSGISSMIAEAIDQEDSEALWALSMDEQVHFNASRNAMQVTGCVEGSVAAHFPLPEVQALALREHQVASTPNSPWRIPEVDAGVPM